MPPIYYLNPPPNPFWDFVAGLDLDHPNFRAPPQHRHQQHGPPSPPTPPETAPAAPPHPAHSEMSDKAQGKQATVEDPPEVDPESMKQESKQATEKVDEKAFPFRGRGRFAHEFDGADNEPHRGRGGHPCRRGRGHAGWAGPPPFMFGHPFFARHHDAHAEHHGPGHEHRGPPRHERRGPPGHEHRGPPGHEHRGPPGYERRGPPGPPHHRHGPPPHLRGPPEGHHRQPSPPKGPRPGFDLGEFLNKLGDRLGVDLSNAAEGLGLTAERFTAGRTSQDINFEPRADIFENKNLYTIHLSLPGAQKSDIGVDYDGEHSVLRVTGVVHRPDVDEQMLNELVVDGRKRETGVFEKAIRIGTKRDPASIDVAGISAKMTDGILIVKVPKVEKVHETREVPISTDPIVQGQADYADEYSEKPVLFDAEEQASLNGTEATEAPRKEPISLLDMKDNETHTEAEHPAEIPAPASKHNEVQQEQKTAKTSAHEEPLPVYSADGDQEEEDWEKFSDASGEGEYIKINVD